MLNMISLFSELNATELEELSKIITEVSYPRGTVIFTQNEMSRDFYIIKHGQVEISVRDLLQEKKVLNILRNGEFFGEMSLFDKHSQRSATAEAFQNTVLYKIPGRTFETLLEDQPSICFKLLGTMSKRLREVINPHRAGIHPDAAHNCQVLTVASARSGYGKTMLATTLAYLLSHELPRRVLYFDLDLNFGDGTFLLGVYTPHSIVDFAASLGTEPPTEEELGKFVYRLPNNLSLLSPPRDLTEAERVSGEDIVKVLNACRRHFDYIIIDTSSGLSDVFLNALDMSDHVFFLVSCSDSISIKSNHFFFRAMSKLNLPESQVHLVLSHRNRGAKADQFQEQFGWKLAGGLPEIQEMVPEAGNMPFQKAPAGEYCNAVRLLAKAVCHENSLHITAESSFLSRWFYQDASQPSSSPFCSVAINSSSGLPIDEEACSSLLKDIRAEVTKGFLDNALRDCLHLAGLNPHSAGILQLLGEIFFLKRDFAQALEVLNKTVELNPESYLALGYIAVIKSDEEMKKKALKTLSAKLDQTPNYPDLLNDLGKLRHCFNQLPEAVDAFQKAVAANPKYVEARLNLAVALGEQHRFDEALRQLFQIKPKNIRTFYLIGNYLFSTGQFCGANAAYQRVSEMDPAYLDIREKLGCLGEYFAKIQNLLELHQKLSRVSPTYPDLHYKIANLHLLLGNRQEAKAEFKWADALHPGFRDVKTKLDSLEIEPEFDTVTFFDAEGIPNHELGFAPESWLIELRGLAALYEKDEDHTYVLRLTNLRTGKIGLFPLYPSLARSSHSEIEIGPASEIGVGDTLEMEVFDNVGVVARSRHKMTGGVAPGQRVLFTIAAPAKPESDRAEKPQTSAEMNTKPEKVQQQGTI
jgi:CRP-like cAMP-binding protein/tetratricopeptide (TPR) repeat protein